MISNILITAATEAEMRCLQNVSFKSPAVTVKRLVTGIGPVAAVYATMLYLKTEERPDLLINIGIAGSFRNDIPQGSVVIPLTDRFADLGVCDGRKFIPLEDTGIEIGDEYTPVGTYSADENIADRITKGILPVKAITVSRVTGSKKARDALVREFNPDIESMEGAAAYYVCNKEGIPCVGIRAVSNKVGPRDRASWDLPLAIDRLAYAINECYKNLIV